MNREVEWSLAVLTRWRDGLTPEDGRDAATAALAKVVDYKATNPDATARDVLRYLEDEGAEDAAGVLSRAIDVDGWENGR